MEDFSSKIVRDYQILKAYVKAHQILGKKIICTIGSWDLLHIGHLRYLTKARIQGDILVVGVDSDRAIKLYKNELRPIVPETERMEMLSYQSCIDYITLIDDIDDQGKWGYALIEAIQPDVFVCINESYPDWQKQEIEKYVSRIVELPRQAESTSTSDIIEKTVKAHLGEIKQMSKKNQ